MKRTIIAVAALLAGVTASAQKASLSTNTVDWLYFITPNAELQYALGQHWSMVAEARVNAWSWRTGGGFEKRQQDEMKARQQTYSAGIRWWGWNVWSGWWAGARGQWSEYDYGGTGFLPWIPENEAGSAWGLGVDAGYAWQLSPRWDLDLSLGIWSGYRRYTTYACPYCGTVTGEGGKAFLLPNEARISLLYVF